ncbi:unnamed protein product [Prorocentrum cordatum]|uniref:Uncharacterized protein n=1 Tax=Prorocentrum cordatum TaxID=2364126 RepID=A0ABN9T192_9DINO|nr:unnamed protein product [Polarella glacialis]
MPSPPEWWKGASEQLVKEQSEQLERILTPIKEDVKAMKGDISSLQKGQDDLTNRVEALEKGTSPRETFQPTCVDILGFCQCDVGDIEWNEQGLQVASLGDSATATATITAFRRYLSGLVLYMGGGIHIDFSVHFIHKCRDHDFEFDFSFVDIVRAETIQYYEKCASRSGSRLHVVVGMGANVTLPRNVDGVRGATLRPPLVSHAVAMQTCVLFWMQVLGVRALNAFGGDHGLDNLWTCGLKRRAADKSHIDYLAVSSGITGFGKAFIFLDILSEDALNTKMDHRPVIAHIDWDVLDCGTVGSQDRYSLDSTLRVRALPKRGFTDAQGDLYQAKFWKLPVLIAIQDVAAAFDSMPREPVLDSWLARGWDKREFNAVADHAANAALDLRRDWEWQGQGDRGRGVTVRGACRTNRESEACTDAAPGDWCHAAVVWAKTVGYKKHPEWFPGDASQYSLRDFQSLLHSLGEAQCSRPCPLDARGVGPRAVGLLELGEKSAAGLGGGSAPALSQTSAYGLSPAEFTGILEESWEPKTATSTQDADKIDEVGCQDAQRGSMCHHAMTFLRAKGIAKHPTWYPSLSGDSTMRDVQEVLHTAGKADCPKPCPDHGAEPPSQHHSNDVIEVFDGGRQVESEAYELKEAADCGDTVEGEWCYNSIMWLKNAGLAKHPDWYPRLTRESSMADFQTALHKQRKMNCPLPCQNVSNVDATVDTERSSGTDFEETSQEEVSTTIPEPIRTGAEQCEDAVEGSHCYKAISRVIDVGIWMHPDKFRGLNRHSSRDQVQKYLYQYGRDECSWPCPKKQLDKSRRVLKRVEDMTEKELGRYMSHEWDGYVDSDEYDPHEAVQPSDAEATLGAPAVRSENASAAQDQPSVAAEETGDDNATLPSTDEDLPEHVPVINPKRQTVAGLKDSCRDAQVGELCYSAVTWAQGVGLHERPQWYTGLSKTSTFREFQAFLHKSRPGICEMPCGNLREVRPFEAEAEAADTSEELLPVIDGGGQKVVPTTTTEPTPEPEVQANSTAEEEPAEWEAESNDTSEEALPAVDPDGLEVDSSPDLPEAPPRQEANLTAEEPVPQPEAAAAEATTTAGSLPAAGQDGQDNASAVEEPAQQREADAAEGATASGEEPASQPEAASAASAESAAAGTSEDLLPEVDLGGRQVENASEDVSASAQQPDQQAPGAGDAAMEAEQASALRGAGADVEANSTAEEPAQQTETATVESDTSEEPLPVVDPDGQEVDIVSEDMASIAQQRAAAKEQEDLRAMVERLKAENAALKSGAAVVQPAPEASEPPSAEPADQQAVAELEPPPQPQANATADEETAAAAPASSAAGGEAPRPESAVAKPADQQAVAELEPPPQPEANATADEEEANTTVASDAAEASDDNATSSTSEQAAFARKETTQSRPRRKAVDSDPLPYVNQEARVTSIMEERDEEEPR